MLVIHVDTFKNRAMLTPRSRAVKKLYGASIRNDIQQIILGVENKFSLHVCPKWAYAAVAKNKTIKLCDIN